MSVFGVVLVRISTHFDWIRGFAEEISVFSPNAGKYGPKKLRIWTLFTQHIFPKKSRYISLNPQCQPWERTKKKSKQTSTRNEFSIAWNLRQMFLKEGTFTKNDSYFVECLLRFWILNCDINLKIKNQHLWSFSGQLFFPGGQRKKCSENLFKGEFHLSLRIFSGFYIKCFSMLVTFYDPNHKALEGQLLQEYSNYYEIMNFHMHKYCCWYTSKVFPGGVILANICWPFAWINSGKHRQERIYNIVEIFISHRVWY